MIDCTQLLQLYNENRHTVVWFCLPPAHAHAVSGHRSDRVGLICLPTVLLPPLHFPPLHMFILVKSSVGHEQHIELTLALFFSLIFNLFVPHTFTTTGDGKQHSFENKRYRSKVWGQQTIS